MNQNYGMGSVHGCGWSTSGVISVCRGMIYIRWKQAVV